MKHPGGYVRLSYLYHGDSVSNSYKPKSQNGDLGFNNPNHKPFEILL